MKDRKNNSLSSKLLAIVLACMLVSGQILIPVQAEEITNTPVGTESTVITEELQTTETVEEPEKQEVQNDQETADETEPEILKEEAPDYSTWDTIKVFETTDVHGWITDVSSYKEETFQYRLAYFSKIVNEARNDNQYEGVLLLDSGDIYQGTPHSNLTYGSAIRAAYDQMDYDAVGLGTMNLIGMLRNMRQMRMVRWRHMRSVPTKVTPTFLY